MFEGRLPLANDQKRYFSMSTEATTPAAVPSENILSTKVRTLSPRRGELESVAPKQARSTHP